MSKPRQDSLSIWIVVAAYNEESRISATLMKLLAEGNFHVVVVDDGSADKTVAIARGFPVWVLSHPLNCGQGAALRTGIEFALAKGADFIVTFDADGQHEASEIECLLEPVRSGRADLALGSRFRGQTERMPLQRRCLLKAAVVFTRLTTGLPLTDAHNGFRAMNRHAAESIEIKQPRMAHASEILDQIARKNLRYEEVPVTIRYTEATLEKGQSTFDAARIGGDLMLGRFVK
ncbi:glycosyltransferase family 2 protein [Rubripirellula amarantea]|uniref:glycosyltransferase family 2 protein n=1 Tax=Rubripirellula amarantea TaxID=2527999 RepID=UPI001F5F45C1|nr:glycosyltransferase family 2 protein [Rubripirellula amarantea]